MGCWGPVPSAPRPLSWSVHPRWPRAPLSLASVRRQAALQSRTSGGLMQLEEAPTESVSFPWYAPSCQRHNWPIARWHLEYLGQLSTCNCEDLELACYFWFSLIVLPRNSYGQTSQIPRDFWEMDAFLHPLGKIRQLSPFPSLGKLNHHFPQILSFWILGAMVITIPLWESCYEDLKRHQPCLNSMQLFQYACFPRFSCMLCMYIMHVLMHMLCMLFQALFMR